MRVLLCLLVVVVSVCGDEDVQVKIEQGLLRGRRRLTQKGREILSFTGIPYAKPPLGELRFKPPLPADGWEGVLDVTRVGSECPQIDVLFQEKDVKGEEDCLFINVYTPTLTASTPLPVMVFIHGGGFFSGSGSPALYAPDFLLDKDIVLVSFNYRLGPLGFLSTGDATCPGNNGLRDQVLALKWVQQNIARFSGNPGRVTLFGQSAGGASVHYHTISPLSKGLFHGVIAHSGVTLAPWAFSNPHLAHGVAHKLATLLDCPTDSSEALVNCLRGKTAFEIINTDKEFREWDMHPVISFRPVKESGKDAFLPDDPIELLQDTSKVANVPFMTGITSGDGAIIAGAIFHQPKLLQDLSDNFDTLAPLIMMYRETSPDVDYVTHRIKQFYFQDQPITNDSRYHVVDMVTDAMELFATDESVRLQAAAISAPVFYYYFDYKPPVSFVTVLGDPSGRDYGVCHGDDLQFLFPIDLLYSREKLSKKDLDLIEKMTTLWTDFARTGHPTPAGHQLAHWDAVKSPSVEYMHIDGDGQLLMATGLQAARAHFWATLPLNTHPYTSIRDEL